MYKVYNTNGEQLGGSFNSYDDARNYALALEELVLSSNVLIGFYVKEVTIGF